MTSNNFKNLIKTNLFTDDSFQPLLKKSDQYRKTTQLALQHYHSLIKNFQCYEQTHEKLLVDYEQYIQINEINMPQYFLKYIQLYRNIWSQQKSFNHKLNNILKEMNALCDSLFTNFSNRILTFQNYIRSYKAHENVLIELSKKYFRTLKSIIASIEYYKETFTDVRVIYNMDEKIKRYTACENTYKNLQEELDTIEKKVTQLSSQKTQIIQAYKDIDNELVLMLKAIGGKLINVSKRFVADFCEMTNITVTYFAEKKYSLEQLELKTFFSSDTKINLQECFTVQIDPKKIEFYPAFVVYYKDIREDCYCQLGNLLTATVKETEEKIEKRKKLTKKALEYTVSFIKLYEKHFYLNLKEIVTNFQKVKKNLSDILGSRLGSFLKSCHSILELSIGINEKLIKRTTNKLKNIEACLLQQTKILDLFKNEFKLNIMKFINNKNNKKIFSQKEINQFTEQQPNLHEITALKQSMAEKSQHLTMLIDGFVDKFKKNYDQLKFHYNAIVNDFTVSTNEFYSLCCDTQQAYFGQGFFITNYQKYEADIDNTLEGQRKFFQEINFSSLLKDDQGPISFDAQLNKIEEYKKMKKPISIEVNQKENDSNRKGSATSDVQRNNSPEVKAEEVKTDKGKGGNKHQQFLLTKISFLPDQKFFKSFSCALSDKILLSGRIYITNKRICFHSSFNPSNIFFDATFIQIPKQDIKKIEKKMNAIVFDNSIAVTTVNGEVFFTSFFSRNQAYDLICQALQIDIDECMFEPEEIKEINECKQVAEDDDIKESAIEERRNKINEMLAVHPYKELFSTQYAYPGFNAYKFLKMLEIGGQFTFNRKTYKNFSVYIKECLDHKDYDYTEWKPSPPCDFLNSANIKDTMPLSFSRKVTCMVPVANSGVPFMPKQAKCEETQTLHVVSKDQYIMESTIQNSGVPYAQTFNIKLKRIISSINENACKMTVYLHINFISIPMVKSIIESKSTEQTKNAMGRLESEAKKYLNYLERSKIKAKMPNGQTSNGANPQNEQYQKQIEELKDSEQKLQKELKASEGRFEQVKKILMGSLVLNIVLILILLA